jgi:hypothetical protein
MVHVVMQQTAFTGTFFALKGSHGFLVHTYVILFTPAQKVQNSLRPFSQNSQMTNIIMCAPVSYIAFYQNRKINVKMQLQIYLRPLVKHDFHCADCQGTQIMQYHSLNIVTHRML